MATFNERLAILVEANAGQAIATFKEVGVATKGLAGPVGEASGLLGKFGAQLGGLASVAGPVALAAGFAKFADVAVGAFTRLAGEVKSFRAVAGGTAEDASRLIAAFTAVGISTDTAATAIFQLEKHLATGADKLAAYGVVAVRDAQGNVDMSRTLLSVVSAYNKMGDPVQKAALLTDAFGKSGTALIPVLAKGTQGIKELYAEAESHGLILSDGDISRADQLKAAMRDLKEAVQGVEVEAGRGLIPLVTEAVNLIDKAIARAHDLASGPPKNAKGGLWNWFTTQLHELDKSQKDFWSGIPSLDLLGLDKAKDTGRSIAQISADAGDLSAALQGMVDADRSLASAQRTLAADQRSLAKDTDAYNKLLAQGAVDTQKVADAQTSLAEAGRSLGHAQRDQAKAQDTYNKAVAAANILGTDTAKQTEADAANNLADANDAVASAQERANKAAKDLAAAKAGDPDYQQKLADAKQKVADDTQAIADAEYNVGQQALASVEGHNKETTAISGKADAAERLLGDYQQLIALHPDVEAALAPQFPALLGAVLAPDLGNITGGYTSPPPSSPKLPPPTTSTGTTTTTTTTRTANITINTTNETDPLHLGRQIAWQLGG